MTRHQPKPGNDLLLKERVAVTDELLRFLELHGALNRGLAAGVAAEESARLRRSIDAVAAYCRRLGNRLLQLSAAPAEVQVKHDRPRQARNRVHGRSLHQHISDRSRAV